MLIFAFIMADERYYWVVLLNVVRSYHEKILHVYFFTLSSIKQ